MLRKEARQLDIPELEELAQHAESAARDSSLGDLPAQGHCERVLWRLGDLLEHRAYPERHLRHELP